MWSMDDFLIAMIKLSAIVFIVLVASIIIPFLLNTFGL